MNLEVVIDGDNHFQVLLQSIEGRAFDNKVLECKVGHRNISFEIENLSTGTHLVVNPIA